MAEKNRILVVEDSVTQARQLESMLGNLGYEIDLVYSGKGALEYLKTERPALIISDILMPEMDGFELCKIVKSDPELKDITVVLLTQLSDPKEIIRGLECGADDFIVKPYNDDLLLARIKAVLALKLKKSTANRNINILVAEDSPTQAEQLKFLLEEEGYRVETANDGKTALELTKKSRPTLIISDILMPVMDGYEFAQEIRKDESLKKIPIILVTSLTDRKELIKKASVVADGYFTKPYDERYLLNKVRALLANTYIDGSLDAEPLDIIFAGEKYRITAGRRQILTFLLSTYENAVQQNQDLILMQRELQVSNEQLEERVAERTQQLQTSEAKYRMLLENNADAIVVIGEAKAVYFANQAALELFGRASADLIGKTFEFEAKPGEIEIKRPGAVITAEMKVVETTWGAEKARLATLRDITGRKKMEEALRESEENFRALADNANDGIFITMGKRACVYANRRAAEMTGHAVEDLLAGIKEHGHEPSSEPAQSVSRILNSSKEGHYETLIARKDGVAIPIELNASKTKWQGQSAIIIIIRDITERKQREEDLIRASKLESLGTLAGGIAHDFNNLLTGIVGNVSLAKVLVNPEDKAYKILTDLEKASLRAKDLTQQLLTFAKGGAPVKKAASIAELIMESANFIVRGTNIKCEFSFPSDLNTIEADEGQISQVIHNLIINSVQAMPEGGIIRISARNSLVTRNDKLPLKPGEYIKVAVADTGAGIKKENLSKIFDPYFTTKKEGNGLGLATVYSIIKNHDGYVSVHSEPGKGTAFTIHLPALPSHSEKPSPQREDDSIMFGAGRILLMDDEDIVLEAAGEILKELGYEIESARDGVEAVELYRKARESGRPFDIVIMDLTVPGGMGGKEAIKKLHEIDPAVKAIVSSGYSADSIMSDYKKHGFSAVIAKPYRVTDLSKTVHRVIRS